MTKNRACPAYLKEDILLSIHLLLQFAGIRLRPGICCLRLRRSRAPRKKRKAHNDDNAQLPHVVRLTERREDK